MNGDDFNDVYAAFNFEEAQEMSEPREKLYLKVLQTLGQSLDPDDPQSELQEKAVHTIANEYIKNRKVADIMLEEMRDFEEQMVALENELSEQVQKNEGLERAREEDKVMIEDFQAQIDELEDLCNQYEIHIDQLEEDLVKLKNCNPNQSEVVRNSVIEKI